MYRSRRTESFLLLIGDIVALCVALPLALILRAGSLVSLSYIKAVLPAFLVVHLLWVVGFYIFDLYSRQTVAFKRRIFSIILKAQGVNLLVGVMVFYLMPQLGITPKTTLVIDAVLVAIFLLVWRLKIVPLLYRSRPVRAVVVGGGTEFEQLRSEIEQNPKFNFDVCGDGIEAIATTNPDVVIVDSRKSENAKEILAQYVARGGQVLDASALYEDIFDRIPLSLVGEAWFLANITGRTHRAYDIAKRVMDVCISIALLPVLFVLFPVIALVIKLEDGGPIFYGQERVGRFGSLVRMYKFRSMNVSDAGTAVLKSKGRVTRIGRLMRKTRIDELPQLFNVIKGDISLVGPRLEFPALTEVYRREIPLYDTRHIIKPGLSGWAQIYHRDHPHHEQAVQQTRDKLSYDLYYVKNRSLVLDFKIALKTLKTVLFFEGA